MTDEAKTPRKASTGNGKKPKPAKAARAAPLTLAEIEALAGAPIDFHNIYERVDEPVRRKLFAVAAAQQLRDFVNQKRAKGSLEPAEIQSWTPILKRRGLGSVTKAQRLISTMSAEEKAQLLQLVQG